MKPGMHITINAVAYTADLVGPRTTILIRGDGAYVHADTASLNALLAEMKQERASK